MSRFVFWGLLTLIVLSPLPLGSNRPVPWSLLALCTGLLLVLWAVAATRTRMRGARAADRFFLPIALLFLAGLGWMVWQTLGPLPTNLQPEALRHGRDLLQAAPAAGIGLEGGAAWHVLMRLACYGGVFLLAWEYGRRRDRAQTVLVVVVVTGVGYALYGLIVQLSELGLVLWYPKTAYRESLTSTFVNRNSYATYAAIGLLCALALRFSQWRRGRDHRRAQMGELGPQAGREAWSVGMLAIAAGIMAAALVLTGSRGGFYSLAATLALCVVALAVARLLRGWQLLGLVLLGTVAAAGILLSVGGGLAGRLESNAASIESSRSALFRPTVEAIRQRPLTGYGAGSFQGVFEAVNTGELYREGYFIDKAHNTYLELALEAGLPAAASMILAVFAFVALCANALLRRKGVRFALAGLAVSLMVGIHALVDFSLQIPAVAVTYAAVLGVAAAQSLRRLSER